MRLSCVTGVLLYALCATSPLFLFLFFIPVLRTEVFTQGGLGEIALCGPTRLEYKKLDMLHF